VQSGTEAEAAPIRPADGRQLVDQDLNPSRRTNFLIQHCTARIVLENSKQRQDNRPNHFELESGMSGRSEQLLVELGFFPDWEICRTEPTPASNPPTKTLLNDLENLDVYKYFPPISSNARSVVQHPTLWAALCAASQRMLWRL
jgi:hypothetical protein